MAEAKISCPKCGGHIAFPNELAGQEAACPHCGETILLPKPRRAITWAIAGTLALAAVCVALILVWQHRSKRGQLVINQRTPLELLQNQAANGNSQAQLILGWRYYNGEGVATNQVKATNWWTKAAEQGSTSAMTALGDAILDAALENLPSVDLAGGLPITMNVPEESLNWFRKAAELGDTNAMWRIIYRSGAINLATGLPMSKSTESLRWLRKLTDSGDTEAMVQMAFSYLYGDGVETNVNEGLKWLRKAADLKDAFASRTLAQIYESGDGVQRNVYEAVRWYTVAANNGDSSSGLRLAELYRDNKDVKKLEESFKWFLKLAQQFDSSTNSSGIFFIEDAAVHVAEAYDKGLGVDQNKSEAVKWYTKAADNGNRHAQFQLGVKYDFGEGVPVDKQKALQWYLKAAQDVQIGNWPVMPGIKEAQFNLGLMYRNGEGVAKDKQEAFKWFLKSAQQGNASAQFCVGDAYETGVGVLQDMQEAFKWYQKAAYQAHKLAQEKLSLLYYKQGINSPENRIEAHKWASLAAAQGDERAAEFRDSLAKMMTAQEMAEATRRAKAVLSGEALPTNGMPVALAAQVPVRVASVPERPEFEVLSVTARATEKNDMWWRFGYRLTVRNNGSDTEGQWFEIQFLDADGYVIKTVTTGRTVIKPGGTETLTGDTLIHVPGASRVASFKALCK